MFKSIVPYFTAAVLAAAIATGSVSEASAQGPVRVVAQALLQFEAEMKWSAVQDSWRDDRPGWVASLENATTAAEVARALSALEVAMKWEAVNASWRDRRPSWVAEVAAARSPAQVASLLIDLELATTWEAMEDSWRSSRDPWLARVRGVAGR